LKNAGKKRSLPEPTRRLAKIDAPRLANVYKRQRLFKLLNGYSKARIIWVSAPPGYGKTLAVSSWLQARPKRVVWYQCDEGDADPASFFYFLTLALADHSGTNADAMPSLSPELYSALPTFARNYFREFCARLKAPTFLVLDNWQDIPANAPLHELLPVIIEQIPAGIVLLIISREEPPANLARLSYSGRMATLGWADLKLTEQETADIARLYKPSSGQLSVIPSRDLYVATQGWAVGLAVMLRHEAGHALTHFDIDHAAIQSIFNYLTSEIFDHFDETFKDFLLKTACLEYITVPVATLLTGNTAAGDILDTLIRTNAFTLKRPASASYYYHPLFRQLLRNRAAARFGDAGQRQLLAAAAEVLWQNQDPEMAIELLLEARSWPEASRKITSMAPTLVSQGRFRTLSVWIESIPAPLEYDAAWLTYWRAMTQMAIAFPDAESTFERAYRLFLEDGDKLGQMLSIAALLQHIHVSYTAFGRMLPWIPILADLLRSKPVFPSTKMEVAVYTGLFSAIILADPENSGLTECFDRLARLIRSDPEPQSKSPAAVALMNYFAVTGNIVQWRAILPDSQWRHDDSDLSPALRIQNLWMHAFQYHLTGDAIRAHALLDAGVQIADENNLPPFASRLILSKLQASDYDSHAAEIADGLARLAPQLTFAPLLMKSQYHYLCAMFQIAAGNLHLAEQEIEAAHVATQETGYPLASALIFLGMAQIQCETGRFDDAADSLLRGRERLTDFPSPLLDFNYGLVKAEIARKLGRDAEFIAALSAALLVGRSQGYGNEIHCFSGFLPRLVPHALEREIEVEYCRGLVRKRGYRPPASLIPNWPWPVQIHSLGRFEVRVDDEPLEVLRKSQRRPLNLLKAILVSRNGTEINVLMDYFWPDLDGDACRNALDLAIFRLRKLLKHRDAVVLKQGRLMLNRDTVWVDAFALTTLSDAGDADEPPADCARRLLLLYRGSFLADESEPWIFAARERLRSRFLRCVGQLGDVLQGSHSYEVLVDFYQRVLEIEPLAEPVYRSLMHCLIAQGRDAEALRVYQRCAATLSTLLQSQPSLPTRKLYASLLKR
jgi:LuxR family transcriptional regulator, maltose regulon positive regulatory protein